MTRRTGSLLLWITCFLMTGYLAIDRALADDCTPWTSAGPMGVLPFSAGCPPPGPTPWLPERLFKTEERLLRWPDGYPDAMGLLVRAEAWGYCTPYFPHCHLAFEDGFANGDPSSHHYRPWYPCWPEFFVPQYFSNGDYVQRIFNSTGASIPEIACTPTWIGDVKHVPSPPPANCVRGADVSVVRHHTCPAEGGGGLICFETGGGGEGGSGYGQLCQALSS